MATKTANQHDPDQLDAQAAKIAQDLADARARAEQARATLDTARDNALVDFWHQRITEFYDQIHPQVAKTWETFAQAVTGSTEQDTLTAWRTYAQARARAQGEHEVLRREAARRGLRGVRPGVALSQRGYVESITLVLEEWEGAHRTPAATQLATTADGVAEAAEERARSNGEVPNAPEIVARFKLGPHASNRSATFPVQLKNPGDGRTVYFRGGRYDARDAKTAELIRKHARRNSIREIDENDEEIDTFGDTFVPRP